MTNSFSFCWSFSSSFILSGRDSFLALDCSSSLNCSSGCAASFRRQTASGNFTSPRSSSVQPGICSARPLKSCYPPSPQPFSGYPALPIPRPKHHLVIFKTIQRIWRLNQNIRIHHIGFNHSHASFFQAIFLPALSYDNQTCLRSDFFRLTHAVLPGYVKFYHNQTTKSRLRELFITTQ